MGLAEVLTCIFVVLKLTHVIDWSWWTVFIPEYVSLGIAFLWGIALAVAAKKLRGRR